MTAQQIAVLEAARQWLRTPYHHAARVKGVGVDCAQLLIAVYAEAGVIDAFDPGEYPIDIMMHRDQGDYLAWVQRLADEVDSPEPGDVALYKVGRDWSHGAIVVQWPEVIHASRPDRSVVIGDGTAGHIGQCQKRFFRMRGK